MPDPTPATAPGQAAEDAPPGPLHPPPPPHSPQGTTPDARCALHPLNALGARWLAWEARILGPWARRLIPAVRALPPDRQRADTLGARPPPPAGGGERGGAIRAWTAAAPFAAALAIALPLLPGALAAPSARAGALLAFALAAWIVAIRARHEWTIRAVLLAQIVILDRFYHLLVERTVAPTALWDSTFLALDRACVGHWPVAIAQHPPAWAVDALALAYGIFIPYLFSSLFLAALGLGVDCAVRFFTGLTFVYAVSYLGYLAFPTLGPKEMALDWAPLTGIAIWPVVDTLSHALGSHADAFPSLHTAAVVYMLGFDRQYLPARYALYLPWGVGIVLSTVLLREHYVVDLAAGGLIALGGLALCGTADPAA